MSSEIETVAEVHQEPVEGQTDSKKEENVEVESQSADAPLVEEGKVPEEVEIGGGDTEKEEVKEVPPKVEIVKASEVKDDFELKKKERLRNDKLRTLANYMDLIIKMDSKGHSMMLKDVNISGFLVDRLRDEDTEIVEQSFAVIKEISKHPENIPMLQKVNHLTESLELVEKNCDLTDEVRVSAKSLTAELLMPRPHLSEMSDSGKNILSNSQGAGDASSKTNQQSTGKASAFMSTLKRKNKGVETILFIDNEALQQKSERVRITQELIQIKGIISVTYDTNLNHCIVRGKRTVLPETFAKAVAALGLAVFLVRKDQKGEEIKIPITSGKENMNFPPYPEELEPESSDTSSSLARPDQLKEDKTFLQSAKNFFQRSFYW